MFLNLLNKYSFFLYIFIYRGYLIRKRYQTHQYYIKNSVRMQLEAQSMPTDSIIIKMAEQGKGNKAKLPLSANEIVGRIDVLVRCDW
jgi:hypothetical protein